MSLGLDAAFMSRISKLGHSGPGTLGPYMDYTASCARISQDIFHLGLQGFTLPPVWDVLGSTGISKNIWDLKLCWVWTTQLGHPGMSQDILDLGLWSAQLGHPGKSWDVPTNAVV